MFTNVHKLPLAVGCSCWRWAGQFLVGDKLRLATSIGSAVKAVDELGLLGF